eukprot:m.104430 g.104430  ORF g.104430 m.104430 type:complete len:205 (-) comp20944_c0_seq2:629-1243(-)
MAAEREGSLQEDEHKPDSLHKSDGKGEKHRRKQRHADKGERQSEQLPNRHKEKRERHRRKNDTEGRKNDEGRDSEGRAEKSDGKKREKIARERTPKDTKQPLTEDEQAVWSFWTVYGGEGDAFLREALGGVNAEDSKGWEFSDVGVGHCHSLDLISPTVHPHPHPHHTFISPVPEMTNSITATLLGPSTAPADNCRHTSGQLQN